MSAENLTIRRRIALVLLNGALDADGFAPCPGAHLHHGKSGPRDFRVILTGAPTAFCFHGSCAAVVDEFNLELRRRIAAAERGVLVWIGPSTMSIESSSASPTSMVRVAATTSAVICAFRCRGCGMW